MTKIQLKVGAVLNYIVIILNIIVGLLYTPFMLRMMGQSEYGLYSLVASVISYLTVLDLGLGNAIVRYTAKYRAEGKVKEQYEMFGMFLILYIGIGILAFLAGLILFFNIENLFGKTMTIDELLRAKVMMIILVLNLTFTFPLSIFGSIMTAYERFIFPKIINIARTILNTIIMIILLELGYKAIAMVSVLTFFNIITLLINYIYCRKELNIQILFSKFNWSFLREVAFYSFWIFLGVIMDRVYWNTGQFVLGAISGTIAVSVYAVAIHLESTYLSFSSAISSVFLPKVTGMVTLGNDKKEISNLFIKTGRLQNIVLSFILFGFITFGQLFVNLWAGKTYSEAYVMTTAFFIALYIPLIQSLGITILQARNEMKFRSILYLILATFALIAEVICSKIWGGIGCAFAISGALIIGQGLIMNIYYQKKQGIDIKKFWTEILKMNIGPFIVSIIFFILYRYFNFTETWLSLGVLVLLYCLVYFPTCYIFSMNQYEKNLLIKPILYKIIK